MERHTEPLASSQGHPVEPPLVNAGGVAGRGPNLQLGTFSASDEHDTPESIARALLQVGDFTHRRHSPHNWIPAWSSTCENAARHGVRTRPVRRLQELRPRVSATSARAPCPNSPSWKDKDKFGKVMPPKCLSRHFARVRANVGLLGWPRLTRTPW